MDTPGRGERGFTLIELSIVLVTIGLIVGGVCSLEHRAAHVVRPVRYGRDCWLLYDLLRQRRQRRHAALFG